MKSAERLWLRKPMAVCHFQGNYKENERVGQSSQLRPQFHLLYEASTAQTLYQKQLPLDLQEREYLQEWLKDTTIPHILARLVEAETKEIDNETARNVGC